MVSCLAAGLSAASAACAQTAISIDGLVDIGVLRSMEGHTGVGAIQKSHVAFSGSEPLGAGVSATFALSTRFDPATGTLEFPGKSPLWHGESTVGLKGGLGAVQFGRRLDIMYANDWRFDPWENFDSVASPAWDLWHYHFPSDPYANNGYPDYGRLNNGIFYQSPWIQGFALHLSASPDRRDGRRRARGAALLYQSDMLAGMAAHATNSAGHTDAFYGLKATLASWSLMAAFDRSVANASVAKALTFGVSYRAGRHTLKAGWGRLDLDGSRARRMVALGSHYALSARTGLYVDFAHKSFETGSANVYGVGLAHRF